MGLVIGFLFIVLAIAGFMVGVMASAMSDNQGESAMPGGFIIACLIVSAVGFFLHYKPPSFVFSW